MPLEIIRRKDREQKQKADSKGELTPDELAFFRISQLNKELNVHNDKVRGSFP